ncbi:MAG: NADH-quinone oxidoreductase subunit N, partial [Mesorhizobium sp.]
MTPDLLSSLSLSTPELILAIGALALLMVGAYSRSNNTMTVTGLAVAVLVIAGLWLAFSAGQGTAYGSAFVQDSFGRFMKMLALIGSAVTLVMSMRFARQEHFDKFEYPVLIVLCTLGMMLMISANGMIGLYLGLELQSLAIYVLAAINRDNLRSTEAGLKYFVLGALSSGMLLYGISLVYGYTGNTGFHEIATALGGGERQLGLVFGLVFVLAGLAFKISAVPFHMWN